MQPSIRQAIEDVNRYPPQNEVTNDQPAIEPPQNEVTNDPPQNEVTNKPSWGVKIEFLTKENKEILKEQGLNPVIVYFKHENFEKWYKKEIEKAMDLNKKYGREKGLNTRKFNANKMTNEEKKEEEKRLDSLIELNSMYADALEARSKFIVDQKGHGFSPSAYGTFTPRPTAACGRSPRRTKYAACPVLNQMIERARVLIGEINAGNTSVNLRNELSRILLTLYKNKRISKEEYRRFATM